MKPWRVIIAGGRTVQYLDCLDAFQKFAPVLEGATEIVSGACPTGADFHGQAWAKAHNIPVTLFPADWGAHGRAAGPIRNRQMAAYGAVLIAIWDGKSRGTQNMIESMRAAGKPVWVWRIQGGSMSETAEPS